MNREETSAEVKDILTGAIKNKVAKLQELQTREGNMSSEDFLWLMEFIRDQSGFAWAESVLMSRSKKKDGRKKSSAGVVMFGGIVGQALKNILTSLEIEETKLRTAALAEPMKELVHTSKEKRDAARARILKLVPRREEKTG